MYYLPLDLYHFLFQAGASFPKFFTQRKQALGKSIFYIHLAGFTKKPTLVICDPEDQAEIMKKEGKMKLYVDMPKEMNQTHGPGNLQVISGSRHNFVRKIFAGLISPPAMKSFVPIVISCFEEMWAKLEKECEEKESNIIFQDKICETQFFLMSKLFFGMSPDSPAAKAELVQLRGDFELQLESHFQPEKSEKFQNGVKAAKRIRKILSTRFSEALERRREVLKDDPSEAKQKLSSIGSALDVIADALIRDSKDEDPKVLSDVEDNLNLLFEASHGTTMTITTSALYFLNLSKNDEKLEKLRDEVSNLGEAPSYEGLKGGMPFAEGCIKETMRLAPIVGSIAYAMDEGHSVTFKGQELSGPMSFMLSFSHNYMDSSIFPDPSAFKPERWIAGHEDEASERARMAYRPFGTGRHICLGYQLALLVMKASLYCFAVGAKKRTIKFDESDVTIVNQLFPEAKVKDGFSGRVCSE